MVVDYIIVGQGLAGSAVAVQLLKLGRKFVVFDDSESNNSSRIAAGLFNPITGKKMVKTWLADTIFPYLHRFYREVEELANTRFFYPCSIYRPFFSFEEQNEWMARSDDPGFKPYIDLIISGKHFDDIRDTFGGLLLKQSGFVDTTEYIRAVSILIKAHASLVNNVFRIEDLELEPDTVRYDGIIARKIIFCSGVHHSEWFKWLPVTPLKGETLTIRNNFQEKIIVNRNIYMVPSNQTGIWRVGSTYNFQDSSPGVTSKGRSELEEKIKILFSGGFQVIDHQWGFRPTTPDRRPILGCHPTQKNLVVFNGLGTKGISLAPYFSEVLIHSLENWRSIHKEVDIERFKSVYWGSPE